MYHVLILLVKNNSYNLTELDLFLKDVMTPHYNKPYGLKLPPFFDPVHINNICEVIKKYTILNI